MIRRRKPAEATAAGAGAEGAGTRAGGMWGGVLDSWDDVRDSGRNALVALHAARQGKSAAAAGEQEMDWLMLASMAEFPGKGGVDNNHSTHVESPPRHSRVRMSIRPEVESCSDLGSRACSQ